MPRRKATPKEEQPADVVQKEEVPSASSSESITEPITMMAVEPITMVSMPAEPEPAPDVADEAAEARETAPQAEEPAEKLVRRGGWTATEKGWRPE